MGIEERFRAFPSALRERTSSIDLAGVPALLATPEGDGPWPVMIWMHGRTADKELDPGRYLRWIRSGIAAVALDLPGHGARPGPRLHDPEHTPAVLSQMVGELDGVLEALRRGPEELDLTRLGIGGMSAGGMVALRRLCDPHPFRCAAVESTTGWLHELYFPSLSPGHAWTSRHRPGVVEPLDPMTHIAGFRPIPLLALHSEADHVVPLAGMRAFLGALGDRYEREGQDRAMITLETWPMTGAPSEHAGFGKVASEAKTIQTEFLLRHLAG